MNRHKLAQLALLLMVIAAVLILTPRNLLTLTALQQYQQALTLWYELHPLSSTLLYVGVYLLLTALCIPSSTLLTLMGGAIFPFPVAFILVSFASTTGALLAMLTSRYFLADWVAARYPQQIATLNAGIEREGSFYLFALRLVPGFPFFLVNLLSGITTLSAARFWWVSFIGMLPARLVFLHAGQQLSTLQSVGDILSLNMLLTFALIGLLPLISRRLLTRYKHKGGI
ncbi:MAG: VTT domain-containing protein [Leclercia sp.]